MCHFHICGQMTKLRSQGVKQKVWIQYLFPNLDTVGDDISTLSVCTEAEIEERKTQLGISAYYRIKMKMY